MAIEFNVVFEENNKSFDADFGVITTVSPNDIYIGPDEPTSPNIKLWIDTDEQEPNYYDKTETDKLLAAKQDALVAGKNITIEGNIISASGGGASDHSQLTNLDYEHSGHTGFAAASDIPTKVSELENDSGFIASYTETDPIYSADKPNLALKSEIPSKTSDLTNDSGFITGYTESDPIYTADRPKIALKSEIPNKISAFENDAGYATEEELAVKQDKLTAGDNITIENNVISATGYELPIASASVLGGIKVGTGLSIDTNGVLSLALTNANGVSF